LTEFGWAKARGAVFSAICCTQSTNPIPIELRDALELDGLDTRIITEYNKRNQTIVGYTRGLQGFEVPEKLTLEEAVGVFEIWKGMKVFGSGKPNPPFFNICNRFILPI